MSSSAQVLCDFVSAPMGKCNNGASHEATPFSIVIPITQ